MRDVQVVTCFLLRRGEGDDPSAGSGQAQVLLLRRSERVGTYRGLWASVSGYLEASTPLEQAYREIEEEVGLGRGDPSTGSGQAPSTHSASSGQAGSGQAVRLLAQGEPLVVPDKTIDTRWTVHPFLFEVLQPEHIRLDWEHTESRWVKPEEVPALETVPGLAEALARVYAGR
jgi:8-oxo-dGTP pyrophosphatase MutT (NUDIX family)